MGSIYSLEMTPEQIVFSDFQRDILSFRKERPNCAIISFSTSQWHWMKTNILPLSGLVIMVYNFCNSNQTTVANSMLVLVTSHPFYCCSNHYQILTWPCLSKVVNVSNQFLKLNPNLWQWINSHQTTLSTTLNSNLIL